MIDSNVSKFYINRKGDCVFYNTLDDQSYIKQENKEKRKLGSAVQFLYASEDLSKIYYNQNKVLYMVEDGNEPKKIASNVERVLQIYKSGAIYYLANAEDDSKRNVPLYSLFFYAQGKSTLVKKRCILAADRLGGKDYSLYCSGDKPIMVFSVIEEGEFEKHPNEDVFTLGKFYVCKESKIIGQLGKGFKGGFVLNAKQDTIYYVQDFSMVLYRVKLEDEKISKSTKYADIQNESDFTLDENKVIYLKNRNDTEQDLYIDGKKIDTYVDNRPIRIGKTNYYTYIKGEGKTLILYYEGVKQVIADHVTSYVAYREDRIAYVNINSKGERNLYLYEGKEEDKQIDSNVLNLLIPEVNTFGCGN